MIQYIGEHLWIGRLGQFIIFLAFCSAILSFISYYKSTKEHAEASWKNIGRYAFLVHGSSIFSIIALIFYMMINQYFEYEYVWSHVSSDLPFRYIFSAFWEGQEGSFLLWMFWNVVLGFILMKYAGKWESYVLAIFSVVQIFFVFFLLGIYWGPDDMRIGASPFRLLRDVHFAPIFNSANYLQSIEGTGLNPLLQNYWMTIHPPTLFLGFSSTLVPFAYAMAGLWRKEHTKWMQPALRWSLFSAAILGTGILMGAVWAYEALSFGGYWAWDPVENASLVPWLTLVAGIHTILIARATGHSIRSSYIFLFLTFFLIIYSTFLTRSGILGETSVHAFTEMGLEWQMVIMLAVIALGFFILYLVRRKTIPVPVKEESIHSKEFWMFMGSLTLLFSACLITATTSIPVFNAISGMSIAPPEDVVAHHNNFQLWIGILIAIFSGISQHILYKKQSFSGEYARKISFIIGGHIALSVLLTVSFMSFSGIQAWQYWALVGTGIFSITSNLHYLYSFYKVNPKTLSSSVSHIGFGLLLVGIIFSGALKRALFDPFASSQLDGILGGLNKQASKNVLVPKGQTVELNDGFTVHFADQWFEGNTQNYELSFIRKDSKGEIIDRFVTQPNVIFEELADGKPKFISANPSTKHYLHRDVFTLAVPDWAFVDPEKDKDTVSWQRKKMQVGDTLYTSANFIIYRGIDNQMPQIDEYTYQDGDIPVSALLDIHTLGSDSIQSIKTLYFIRDQRENNVPTEVKELGLTIKLSTIIPAEGQMVFEFKEKKPKRDYVIVQAIIFPGIQLVWLGSIMMMFGLLLGLRVKHKKNQKG